MGEGLLDLPISSLVKMALILGDLSEAVREIFAKSLCLNQGSPIH